MKMTRLEWRYLQRIALDHPYYDTHKPPLSDAEARAIMEANNTMTGREFVDSIYAKLGMTRPVKEKKRLVWLSNIGELFTVPPIRKIAITVLVVVLLTIFFAATPTGRAIADSVIHYIVTSLDNGALTINQSDSEVKVIPVHQVPDLEENAVQENTHPELHVNTFEEFTIATGLQPVVLPFQHTELYYYHNKYSGLFALTAVYETSNGKITTYQTWNAPNLVSSTSTGFTVYAPDPSVYFSVEANGETTVLKIYEDSVLTIYTENSYTVEELVNLLTIE